ncbi:hypothetical protein K439DRAFT_1343466 [Ramaria rubella]|nr:hypothetical protein K439DRAFT_1343466 [Ramaria rubella]
MCAGLQPHHPQRPYFKQLSKVIDEYQIPAANIYNWDEKGIQLGGGHKGLQAHYIFTVEDLERYVAWSDSLELMSLLKAVCADG